MNIGVLVNIYQEQLSLVDQCSEGFLFESSCEATSIRNIKVWALCIMTTSPKAVKTKAAASTFVRGQQKKEISLKISEPIGHKLTAKKRKQKRNGKKKNKKARHDSMNSDGKMMTEEDDKKHKTLSVLSADTVNDTVSKENKPYQPVLGIKKPEDYSANWKQLKDIITKGDKRRQIQQSEAISKGGLHNIIKEKQTKNNTKKKTEKPGSDEEEEDIWFDNVDPRLIERSKNSGHKKGTDKEKSKKAGTADVLIDTNAPESLTDIVAMDCEMVGVGYKAKDSMLARVSIVNQHGRPVYDKFVLPMEKVEDYRTAVSGVRPSDLENAEPFFTVQREVYDLIKDRILVGHSLKNDFRALYLSHPRPQVRDTSRYLEFRKLFGGRTPSLKKLAERVLGVQIQEGEHNSVQDAQAAMRLYMTHQVEWETMLKKAKRRKIAAQCRRAAGKKAKKLKDKGKNVSFAPASHDAKK